MNVQELYLENWSVLKTMGTKLAPEPRCFLCRTDNEISWRLYSRQTSTADGMLYSTSRIRLGFRKAILRANEIMWFPGIYQGYQRELNIEAR